MDTGKATQQSYANAENKITGVRRYILGHHNGKRKSTIKHCSTCLVFNKCSQKRRSSQTNYQEDHGNPSHVCSPLIIATIFVCKFSQQIPNNQNEECSISIQFNAAI